MGTSATMQAVRITQHGGPEVLELVDVAIPTPGPGEALIRVSAVALNNTDVWTRQGAYGLPGDPTAPAGWRGALGGYDVRIDVRRVYLHNIQLIGSSMYTPLHFELLMGMARRPELHPIIAATFPLDQAALAQEELAHRGHVGKIVLHPPSSD